jgi:2-dehydro-3-deoxygluconokinase
MTEDLKPKSKSECRWDLVSLGEVMLRLDPGDERIHTTRNLRVWEGGGDAANLSTWAQSPDHVVDSHQ